MGLSIAISGAITMTTILAAVLIVFLVVDQIFTQTIANSAINKINDSISKTNMKINSVDGCSGSNVVKVALGNNGIEKLSDYDRFDLFATYDADIGSIKTRVTEQFVYNATAFSVSQGKATNATEIPHSYVEVISRQNTNNPTYSDLPAANLSSANFEINKKYLIYVTAQVGGNVDDEVFAIRSVHGVTPFPGSEFRVEPRDTSTFHTYAWFTVWNPTTVAEAAEDIKLQYRRHTGGGGDIGRYDQVTMFAMEISEDLTENVDWFFDEDTTQTSPLPNTWTGINNAAVTFTPDCPNDDWLVMATAQIDPASTGLNYETRLEATGGVTIDVDHISKEGEDGGSADLYTETIVYTYTIPSAATTFTSQSQNDGGGSSGSREYSAVFALNLDKFKNHNTISTPTIIDIGTIPDWVTEVQSLSFNPDEAGDAWILGYFIMDANTGCCGQHIRMQVYETGKTQEDHPPTQTTDLLRQNRQWDGSGEHEWTIQTVENLKAVSYTADIDADVVGTNAAHNAEFRTLAFVSMITEECVGGDSGNNIEVKEWTINCINNDYLDPGMINTHEVAEVLLKTQYPIFPGGLLVVSISADNGDTASKTVLVP